MTLFHQILTEAIASSPFTAKELGTRAEISQPSMSEFTSGKSLPREATLLKICAAFPPATARALAAAWVRGRLGSELADAILAGSQVEQSGALERQFSALPASTREAFMILIENSLDNRDLRSGVEGLAAFMRPAEAFIKHPLSDSASDSELAMVAEKAKKYELKSETPKGGKDRR